MLIHFHCNAAVCSVIFFSFYSLVLWKPDLRLWALIFCISNSVRFLCSQMCLHSCSPSINKKDVCTAGKRILIYLWPELWRMEWPDGHYLNPMWLQTFWSGRGDNWNTKPTLKFASLSCKLQIKSPVTFLTQAFFPFFGNKYKIILYSTKQSHLTWKTEKLMSSEFSVGVIWYIILWNSSHLIKEKH